MQISLHAGQAGVEGTSMLSLTVPARFVQNLSTLLYGMDSSYESWIFLDALRNSIHLTRSLHRNVTPYTLHPTSDTRHPKLHTLHPELNTLHPTPFTLLYTPHPSPYTLHPTPYFL